jgi:hypothetical protein
MGGLWHCFTMFYPHYAENSPETLVLSKPKGVNHGEILWSLSPETRNEGCIRCMTLILSVRTRTGGFWNINALLGQSCRFLKLGRLGKAEYERSRTTQKSKPNPARVGWLFFLGGTTPIIRKGVPLSQRSKAPELNHLGSTRINQDMLYPLVI